MSIQDIDDQLKVKKTELNYEKDSLRREKLQDQIKSLQFKREIVEIKEKIKQLSS